MEVRKMMRPNPMDRNTGGIGYNKLDFLSRLNPSEAHDTFEGLSDQYLSQIIQQNLGLYSTMAAAVLSGRQNASKNLVEAPTSTVADKVAAQTGIPSVAQPQNNQDPRLMTGVGGMDTNPVAERNSMDTPMTGVAQLPAKQMMANGGIVGFQDRGLVEGEEEGGDTDYLAYLAGAGVLSTLNPLKKAKSIYNIGKKGIQKLVRPGGRLRRYGRKVQDRFTDRNYDLYSPNLLKRTFNPVKSAQTVSGAAGSTYLFDKASDALSGDDKAPVAAPTPVAASVANNNDADDKAETAKYNMFDKIVGGITSGDMTRFGLNMAERASKGGSGLTALTGGAFDTRKQLDEITAANLDREAKKLYYEALSTNAVNAAGAKALDNLLNQPGLLTDAIEKTMEANPKLTQLQAGLQVINTLRQGLGMAQVSALGEDNPIDPRFKILEQK